MMSKQIFAGLLFIATVIAPSIAQNTELVNLGELKYVNLTDQLPENIGSTRSAVIVSVSPDSGRFVSRGNWKELTERMHENFRKIGIDPITYIYQDDLNAGPEVTEAYRQVFDQRNVRNLIHINEEKQARRSSYTLLITPFHPDGFMQHGQESWQQSSPDLDMLILRLGRQILRQNVVRSNFLIPEHPEYLDELAVFTGTRYENYPSRLQSLKLAVVAFPKAPTENVSDPEVLKKLEAHNRQVESKNEELAQIMRSYPYNYEIVEETNQEVLYDRGFQYVLMPLTSSARFIKNTLDYQTTPPETIYVSSVFTSDSLAALKRMPVDAHVTKYYIKQTIVKDLHTGNKWDADVTWQQALKNFIFYMKLAFN